MSLLLLTVTLRGVSNKHCLLSLFSFFLYNTSSMGKDGTCKWVKMGHVNLRIIFNSSARIGLQEDLEDIRREEEELKQKKLAKMKKMRR